MFEEILEYGPDAMADNYMKNKPKWIKKTLHSLMEYMLINKKFMEKVNYMSSMVIACIWTWNLRESLAFINRKAINVFKGARRINVWVKNNMANDLWTIHHGSEVRNSASEEFIGYVAMTGDHVVESSNIELSNYYKSSYEK